MEKEFDKIIEEFKKLNRKGYMKGINNNLYNSAGLTLENQLGKNPDSMFLPDYYGIEVKCTQRFSRYNISLFSLAFDGPDLFESNYLLETYGIRDKVYPEHKKLIVNLKLSRKVLVYDKYYFELKIDYDSKKIFIRIYDNELNFLEDRAFIYFDSLEQRLRVKLRYLALFYASKNVSNDNFYFRYYKLECYKYKGIGAFIKCIEEKAVSVALILRFAKSGKDFGKNKNKSMQFSIRKKSLEELFDQIYYFEN